jgi:hypothetical protein
MHRANFSPRAVCCACWDALVGVRVGTYFWHFARAAWYAGALIETPLTEMACPLPSIRIPSLLKSGKFGTPSARMHRENPSVELVGELLRLAEDPQAATAMAEATATKGSPRM